MEWQNARAIIRNSVKPGTDLNSPNSTYRFVISANAQINSSRYKYHHESGIVVSIGKQNKIGIPWKMLKDCFIQLTSSDGYDGSFFRVFFPLQAHDHPCHVHVIGQIFVAAGIAYLDGYKYRLLVNQLQSTSCDICLRGTSLQ